MYILQLMNWLTEGNIFRDDFPSVNPFSESLQCLKAGILHSSTHSKKFKLCLSLKMLKFIIALLFAHVLLAAPLPLAVLESSCDEQGCTTVRKGEPVLPPFVNPDLLPHPPPPKQAGGEVGEYNWETSYYAQ